MVSYSCSLLTNVSQEGKYPALLEGLDLQFRQLGSAVQAPWLVPQGTRVSLFF